MFTTTMNMINTIIPAIKLIGNSVRPIRYPPIKHSMIYVNNAKIASDFLFVEAFLNASNNSLTNNLQRYCFLVVFLIRSFITGVSSIIYIIKTITTGVIK